MKTRLVLSVLFLFPLLLSAQDTIFVKSGQVIPAIIVEKNKTEIKYKKSGQSQSAAIYSIFISDIKSIHYKDGIIADYTQTGPSEADIAPAAPIKNAGTMRAIKFSIGGGAESFKRNTDDALLVFWRNRLADPKATVGGNPRSYFLNFKMNMAMGNMKRNWMGDEVQFIISPSDAIYARNNSGSYEIKLKSFYTNISLYYGRSLNHKNNLLAIIEPGIDIPFVSGDIKLDNISHKIYGNTGLGFHTALGADWLITKRITASLRGGYRFMKIKKVVWEDRSTEPTKFYNFIVAPPSTERLSVTINGPYASFGLQWSFYTKMRNPVIPE